MHKNQRNLFKDKNIFYFISIILIVAFYTYNYFIGAEHSTYLALINKSINPELYPDKVDFSLGASIGELSPFYILFKVFPFLTFLFNSDQVFFIVEVLFNLVNLYFILKITKLFLKDSHSFYLVALILFVFIFDFPVFGFAKSGLGIHGEFSPGVFARPALIASIYYFFIGKYKFSMFLATLIGMLHFKEAWFISSAFLFFIIFVHKDYKTTAVSILFMLIGLFPYLGASIDISNITLAIDTQVVQVNSYEERLVITENILKRERYEADLTQESLASWIVYALLISSAFILTNKLKDNNIKFKLRYILTLSLLMVILGSLYTGYLYQFIPVPKLVLLSPARSAWSSILIATLLLISYLYSQIISQDNIKKISFIFISIILLSIFPFNFIFIGLPLDFPTSRGWALGVISSNVVFVVVLALSFYLILGIYLVHFIKKFYIVKNYQFLNIHPLVKKRNIFIALLVSTILIQGSYVLYSMQRSYELNYYNFPLKYSNKKDISIKKLGEWASKNLPIDSMVLGFSKKSEGVYNYYKHPYFTVISSRPYYLVDTSLNPESLKLIKKSKYRIEKVIAAESFLNNNDLKEFQEVLIELSIKDSLTHIFVSSDVVLELEEVYFNAKTRLYKIN